MKVTSVKFYFGNIYWSHTKFPCKLSFTHSSNGIFLFWQQPAIAGQFSNHATWPCWHEMSSKTTTLPHSTALLKCSFCFVQSDLTWIWIRWRHKSIPPVILLTKPCFTAAWPVAIDKNDNIWSDLGQDITGVEFAHSRWAPRGHLRSVWQFANAFTDISFGGGFEVHDSFVVYLFKTDIPIICLCQVTELWRHWGDTASSMSTYTLNIQLRCFKTPHFVKNLTGNTLLTFSCRFGR